MNDPEKRTCPFCAEIIKAEAKLCPRCHQWLTLKSFRHPLVFTLGHVVPLTAIWIVFGVAWLSMMERFENPKPYYSEFPGSLRITESRMNWAQTDNGLRIYITGMLTNTSPVAWKGTEFDCRFFDSNGVMVDADTGHGYVTISSYDDAAFRVAIIPIAPTNDYASFKISLGNARNTKGWF
jgi:hypothetical protein